MGVSEEKLTRVVFLSQSEYFRDPRVLKESVILSNRGFLVDVFCYQYVFDYTLPISHQGVNIHRILCAGVDKKTTLDVLMRFFHLFYKFVEDVVFLVKLMPKKGGIRHIFDICVDRLKYMYVIGGVFVNKLSHGWNNNRDMDIVYYNKKIVKIDAYSDCVSRGRWSNFYRNFINFVLSYIIFNVDMYFKSRHVRAEVYHATDLVTLLAGFLLKKKNGGMLIYDTHELWIDSLENCGNTIKKILKLYETFLIHRADVVITVNESIADELVNRYNIPRPVVVLNCPIYEPVDCVSTPLDEIKVLYQGVYIRDRGIEELLRSVKYLDSKCKLYLRGYDGYVPRGEDGEYMKYIRNIAEEEGVRERVVFLNPVEMMDMVRLSTGFDIGVTPYKPTNMNQLYASPNKTFEYMMAGLAVVVSDIPEQKRFVVDNFVGLSFDPESPYDIASAINKLVNDPRLLMEMKANAIKCAKTKYNWDIQGDKFVEVYKKLCDPHL